MLQKNTLNNVWHTGFCLLSVNKYTCFTERQQKTAYQSLRNRNKIYFGVHNFGIQGLFWFQHVEIWNTEIKYISVFQKMIYGNKKKLCICKFVLQNAHQFQQTTQRHAEIKSIPATQKRFTGIFWNPASHFWLTGIQKIPANQWCV